MDILFDVVFVYVVNWLWLFDLFWLFFFLLLM